VRRLFLPSGRIAAADAVRIHPWICFEKFQTKEKLQHLYDAGVFGGRGWITQAALLKTAHWAVFARRDAKRRAAAVLIHPPM